MCKEEVELQRQQNIARTIELSLRVDAGKSHFPLSTQPNF